MNTVCHRLGRFEVLTYDTIGMLNADATPPHRSSICMPA
jgi:hypothetical protein